MQAAKDVVNIIGCLFVYITESRMLSFKTVNFGPLACIQDKHINMPFQSWELRPVGVDHARFTIIAAIIEAEIEIKVNCPHMYALDFFFFFFF